MNMKSIADTWSFRFKMMMRHTWLIVLAGMLLLAGLGVAAYQVATLPTELKIAVGPVGSDDYQVVQKFQEQLADRPSMRSIKLTIVDVGSSQEAADLIDADKDAHELPLLQRFFGLNKNAARVDFAVVRRDLAMPKEGLAIAILRKNVVAIWVPPPPEPVAEEKEKTEDKSKSDAKGKTAAKSKTDAKGKAAAKGKTDAKASKGKAAAKKEDDEEEDDKPKKSAKPKIEKIEDLLGKRVGVIGRSQANIKVLRVILEEYGFPADKVAVLGAEDSPNAPDKLNVVQFSTDKVDEKIRNGKFDAIMAVGPISSKITADAIKASRHGKEAPTFIEIKAAEAIAARNPAYESDEIKAGAFGGAPPLPEESVDTISINHYIVARKKLSDDTVAEFTRYLFTIRASLASRSSTAAKIEKPDTDKDANFPVHPGAVAYLDGELKNFFDRYNDYLYWGLMLFSFFGSAIAGIASYSKADDRVRRLQTLERLLELGKAARAADSIPKLDEIQAEADKVMGEMVQDVETDKLDETALMAFSVTLDQVQRAISDRRASLLGRPGAPSSSVAST